MADGARCSGCGAELVADASPQGLCPACLLKLGLSDPNIRVEPVEAPPAAPPPRVAKPSFLTRMRFPRPPWPVLAGAGGAVLLVALTAFVVLRLHPRLEAPVFRMSLNPSVEPEEFAISPDGRRVAFTAASDDGKTVLWIHSLDAIGDQALSGTEDATHPFWSPDSRFVGFFAEGKLKKIDASNGGAQTLADVPDAPEVQAAAWSSEGVILFAANSGSLNRVSANGGTVDYAVGSERPDMGPHRFPNFLPDGRHFLFSISGSSGERNGAYVSSLDSGEYRRLTNASSAAYADGRLLFVRDGLLMAQPLDSGAMELSGEAQPIRFAEHVESFSVSQNGVLAYRAGDESSAGLVFVDRTGRLIDVVDNVTGVSQFSISPDSSRIAFSRQGDIFISDLSRGFASRFTSDSADDSFPLWSPDGKSVAFLSSREEGSAIYLKEINLGKEMILQKVGPRSVVQSIDDWSSDGRFITYTTRDGGGKSSVWALSNGENHKSIPIAADFSMRQGRISPDGRWLAYVSNESGRDEIYVQQFPAPEGRWQVSPQGGTNPKWRRDGRELFYVAADRTLVAAQVESRDKTPTFGTPRMLWRDRRIAYDVFPDGQRFLLLQPLEGRSSPIQIIVNWASELR